LWWRHLPERDQLEGEGVEDNNKMDLQEVTCDGKDWSDLVRERDRWRAVVSAVMNFRVP